MVSDSAGRDSYWFAVPYVVPVEVCVIVMAVRAGTSASTMCGKRPDRDRFTGACVIVVDGCVDVGQLTLRGYVDRLDVAPADGALRVVDYKTGRAPSELFEGKALFQMKFYALVIWRTRGVMPLMLQLVYLGNSQFLRYQPDEADLLALERKLKALWRAIERCARTGDWRPKKSRLCSWCDHKALCPEWGGTPPPLPEHAARLALGPRTTGDLGDVDGD